MLEIERSALGHDLLAIDGSATLGGRLRVTLPDGFDPVIGTVFEFLAADAGSVGSFSENLLPALAGRRLVLDSPDAYRLQLQVAPALKRYRPSGTTSDPTPISRSSAACLRKSVSCTNRRLDAAPLGTTPALPIVQSHQIHVARRLHHFIDLDTGAVRPWLPDACSPEHICARAVDTGVHMHTLAYTQMTVSVIMATQATSASMEPLSARIPGDVYLWLAQLQVEGATTNSDKLRVLLGQLKRQYDGALDYVAAHAWARDIMARTREALIRAEGRSGRHSEVVSLLLDHLAAFLALIVSQAPTDESETTEFEDALVRRAFALCETLLRQATTPNAAAYDPAVVRRHIDPTLELAINVHSAKGA
ncbi:MAG: hypothetical protein AB7Q97_16630 [Gammaproteobacteria bacterium]